MFHLSDDAAAIVNEERKACLTYICDGKILEYLQRPQEIK